MPRQSSLGGETVIRVVNPRCDMPIDATQRWALTVCGWYERWTGLKSETPHIIEWSTQTVL
jgi:hypothetical protein